MYSEYNLRTNQSIMEIMESISEKEIKKERNFYYKNLYSLYNHIIIGSWHYLNAISMISNGKYCNNLPALLAEDKNPSINELNELLLNLSEILLDVSNSISDEELNIKKEKIRIYNGRIVDMTIWQYFLQHITHQVHHQGQMSMIFEELDIVHEFGNIFPLIEDSI